MGEVIRVVVQSAREPRLELASSFMVWHGDTEDYLQNDSAHVCRHECIDVPSLCELWSRLSGVRRNLLLEGCDIAVVTLRLSPPVGILWYHSASRPSQTM